MAHIIVIIVKSMAIALNATGSYMAILLISNPIPGEDHMGMHILHKETENLRMIL